MDLFGNVSACATAKRENAIASRALPRAKDTKRDPAPRWMEPGPMVDKELRALFTAPAGETEPQRLARLKLIAREKARFKANAKRGAGELHRRKAGALGMKTGWVEMVNAKYLEG